jgi:hypothetical protein
MGQRTDRRSQGQQTESGGSAAAAAPLANSVATQLKSNLCPLSSAHSPCTRSLQCPSLMHGSRIAHAYARVCAFKLQPHRSSAPSLAAAACSRLAQQIRLLHPIRSIHSTSPVNMAAPSASSQDAMPHTASTTAAAMSGESVPR